MDIRRHHIIIVAAVFALLCILIKPEILSGLFVFLFMGIVPGTDVTLPWWATLLGFITALALGIRWLLDQPVYQPVATNKDRALRHAARRRVLRQTNRKYSTRRHYRKQTAKA